jgi:hypothetical protein
VVHNTIDYPGVPVDHSTIKENHGILKNVRIPIRPHFGVIGVAPKEADVVDSIPPGYFGGNIDNWRVGKGATMYYPVAVPGALLSVGDSHASQGDSELCGTAIECSLTGTFQLIVHKKATLEGTSLAELSYPLLEMQDEWVLHGFSFANYLQELGPTAQQTIYEKSSVDLALKDAFRKMRACFDDHERTHRGRGNRADLHSGRLRGDPSGGRKLGRSRHCQKEPFCGWRGLISKRDEHELARNGILIDDGCALQISSPLRKETPGRAGR